jgi:hypothetical protein
MGTDTPSSVTPRYHIRNNLGLYLKKTLLKDYRICVEWMFAQPQWPRELCRRERKLRVGPPMPDRSKGRGQAACCPWSSRIGAGRGANNPTPENFTVMKPPELEVTMEEAKTHTGL